jgi:hypothetical protein
MDKDKEERRKKRREEKKGKKKGEEKKRKGEKKKEKSVGKGNFDFLQVKLFCQTFFETAPTPLEKSLHQRSRSCFFRSRSPAKQALVLMKCKIQDWTF